MPSSTDHQPIDSRVHQAVLAGFVERGHAPGVDEIAADLGASREEVTASLRRLDANHGLMLHPPPSLEVWVAHPFSAMPTLFWVRGAERGWWGACIWCAMGIAALLGEPVTIHTTAGGEGEPLAIRVRIFRAATGQGDRMTGWKPVSPDSHVSPCSDVSPSGDAAGRIEEARLGGRAVDAAGLVAHFPIPAARAWDNVHRFCGSTLVFAAREDVGPWCARHGVPQGEILPLPQVLALGRAWYGGHLHPDWKKATTTQAAAIFSGVGLTGSHWALRSGVERY